MFSAFLLQGTSDSDILQQALVNSGLPGSEKKKGLVPSKVETMNIRDSATGVVKKHIIRKVSNRLFSQCSLLFVCSFLRHCHMSHRMGKPTISGFAQA